jgi:hypothetical protein
VKRHLLFVIKMVLLCGSAQSADLGPNVVHKQILTARASLMKAGWLPRETVLVNADGERENQWGDAGVLYRAGITEVEFCNGTGANYCFYNYRRGSSCLRLLTQGEFLPGKYQPQVVKQTGECPPEEASASAGVRPAK